MKIPKPQIVRSINYLRAENYAAHFAAREYIKHLNPTRVAYLSALCDQYIPFPLLTPAGSLPVGVIQKEVREQVGQKVNIQAGLLPLINPWYLSSRGWDGFQTLWRNLADEEMLITGKPVDNLWITTAKSVENLLITSGKPVDRKVVYPQEKRRLAHIPRLLSILSTACGELNKLSTGPVDNSKPCFIVEGTSI